MPFPLLSANVSTGCSVSELQKGKRQQYSEIRFGGECPIFQLSKAPLVSPFSAGVFQEDPSKPATRLNLDLTLDAETESVLRQVDEFFEKKLQEIAPGKSYHRLVQQQGDYPARVRCKANTSGPMAARFWSAEQTPLGNIRQVECANAQITACVRIPKVWVMGPSVGVSLELACAVIHENSAPMDVFPL